MAKLEGLNTVAANLQKAIASLPVRTKVGMVKAGYVVLEDSRRIVPVDTGALLRSSYLESENTTQGTVVEVGYGREGSNVRYSVPVHEKLNVRHPNGQAKYLETPLKARFNELLTIIAEEAKLR